MSTIETKIPSITGIKGKKVAEQALDISGYGKLVEMVKGFYRASPIKGGHRIAVFNSKKGELTYHYSTPEAESADILLVRKARNFVDVQYNRK